MLPTGTHGQNKKRRTITGIAEKKLKWYGHIRRNDGNRWIKEITDRSPIVRRKRGRRR